MENITEPVLIGAALGTIIALILIAIFYLKDCYQYYRDEIEGQQGNIEGWKSYYAAGDINKEEYESAIALFKKTQRRAWLHFVGGNP